MTFDQLRRAGFKNPTVALFYGRNCAPCERLKPKLRDTCKKLGVRLEEFNSELEMPVMRELGLRAVPSVVVVMPDGAVLTAFIGDPTERLQRIEDLLMGVGVRQA